MRWQTQQQDLGWRLSGPERLSHYARILAALDPAEHPVSAEANRLAGAVMDIVGSMFWAALIVLFL